MTLLAVPLVFLLSGYVTMALASKGKERPLHLAEGLFLTVMVSLLVSWWIGLVLAEIGAFSLPMLGFLIILYNIALMGLFWKKLDLLWLRGHVDVPVPSALLVIVLALAGWSVGRPAQVIAGTIDPGIYLNSGVNIARTGSIAFSDPSLSELTPQTRNYLLDRTEEVGIGGVRLTAFWMPKFDEDKVIPAFLHLYPVWIAMLYSIGGLGWGLFASPILAVLGVWALYVLAGRLIGPRGALLAASLLAVNVAQIWFGRYSVAEVMVQTLLLAGLAVFALSVDNNSRLLACVAGASFGMVHLAKIDQIFVPAVLFATIFWAALLGQFKPHFFYMLSTYVILAMQAIVHMVTLSFAYAWLNLMPFLELLWRPPGIMVGGFLLLAILAVIPARRGVLVAYAWLLQYRVVIVATLILAVILAGFYAYFIWPRAEPTTATFLSADGTPIYLNMHREEGLVRLGWYLTPLGLLLGVVGFLALACTKLSVKVWPLILLLSLQMITYMVMAGLSYPEHFWAIRRYVPLIIPASVLFASYALEVLHRWHRWPLSVLSGAMAVVLIGLSLNTSTLVLRNTEYEGAIQSLSRWSSALDERAVVLFASKGDGNVLAPPLQYIFGRTSFVLPDKRDPSPLYKAVRTWVEEGKVVYLVVGSAAPNLLSGQFDYQLVYDGALEYAALEQSTERLPSTVATHRDPLRTYRLVPAGELPH